MNTRRAELASNLELVRDRIAFALQKAGRPSNSVTLVVVTKTCPVSDVAILSELGVEDFAENRDHEGREKSSTINGRWHFQGQIQSNKIASIDRWADVIHSLDSQRHLDLIAKALPVGKILSVFIQVSLDPQPGRGGVTPKEATLLAERVLRTPALALQGLMAVAPLGEEPASAFFRLAQIHSDFRQQFPSAPFLSAGMSGDFEEAIAHGATHVRIGSSILGTRSHLR